MIALDYGMIVKDRDSDDMGIVMSIPNKAAEPWINWFCHESCQGTWPPGRLHVALHVLSGRPLYRSPWFDLEATEFEDFEARSSLRG